MIVTYLYVNALLYGLFAAVCTIFATTVPAKLGFSSLTSEGRSEYLVIYGGLQLGLAAMFAFLAASPGLHSLGILFSLALYGPIVLYRAITVAAFWPIRGVTLTIAALEVTLLGAAVGLYLLNQRTGHA